MVLLRVENFEKIDERHVSIEPINRLCIQRANLYSFETISIEEKNDFFRNHSLR